MDQYETIEYRKSATWLAAFLIVGLIFMIPAFATSGTNWVVMWIPAWIFGLMICLKSIFHYAGSRIILDQKSARFLSGAIFKSVTDIPYAKINSVDLNEYTSVLSISTSDNSLKKAYSGMKNVTDLRDELNRRIQTSNQVSVPVSIAAQDYGSVRTEPVSVLGTDIDTLERLANLRDRGAITDAEYENEKRKILQ